MRFTLFIFLYYEYNIKLTRYMLWISKRLQQILAKYQLWSLLINHIFSLAFIFSSIKFLKFNSKFRMDYRIDYKHSVNLNFISTVCRVVFAYSILVCIFNSNVISAKSIISLTHSPSTCISLHGFSCSVVIY